MDKVFCKNCQHGPSLLARVLNGPSVHCNNPAYFHTNPITGKLRKGLCLILNANTRENCHGFTPKQ